MNVDWLIENITIASLDEARGDPYGRVEQGLVAVADGVIAWVGCRDDAPAISASRRIDGAGQWLTPGLVDCHTHLVYAGDRAQEFEARLQGTSYADIARQGGGIASTVTATRAASEQDLFDSAAPRLHALLREGVTTIEIKSGYGLDTANESKMLRVARRLGEHYPVTVTTTFLGAHALPPAYQGNADPYIDEVCNGMLPAVAEQGLADAVDVFCEGIGFSAAQCRRVFTCASALGLPVKAHAEQLSYLKGALLVAEFNGLSADHLEYLPASDLASLQKHGVVPVLLPGAYYYLNETHLPPVAAMRAANMPMAVASDLNPGSSPSASLLLAMNQACVLFGLTPAEALAGVTRSGARALGLGDSKGQVKAGYDADLLLWDIGHPAQLSYAINMHHPAAVWVAGKQVVGPGNL